MHNGFKVYMAIAILGLAALACSAVTGRQQPAATEVVVENTSEPAPLPTEAPLPTPTDEYASDSDVLYEDDFSGGRKKWGTGTDTDSSVEYAGETLSLQLFTGNYMVWTYPNDSVYENVHMEVTANTNGSDTDAAFGFFCDVQQPIDDSRYYLAITPAGEYAIVKAALALEDVVLTNNGDWASSDLITRNAASYRLGADCGNGTLTLYVDGQQVDSVSDSTYTSGNIALFAWSGEVVNTVNITFDDFVMTRLP